MVSAAVWPVFVAWVLFARLGWVALHWSDYAVQSVDILRFWQGGFAIEWGFAAALAVMGWQVWRRRTIVVPLVLTCGAASAAGGLALLLLTDVRSLTLPDLVLSDLSDLPVSLIHPEGALVVNLWASWCPPCRRELPMMVERASSAGAPRFVFANQGETPAQVKSFLTRAGLGPDHIALDPGYGLMGALDAAGLPVTLFFDADGQLVASHVGEISRADLSRRMKELTGESE